jgi:single-stranded DNA-binding protein
MEISGTVKMVGDVQQVTATFKKRELVVTTEEQYPQHILVEFVQDRTDILNTVQPGDRVSVGINLRGREWQSPQGETKYFNTIQGWRIEKQGAAAPQAQAASTTSAAGMPPMPPMEEDDDLPF